MAYDMGPTSKAACNEAEREGLIQTRTSKALVCAAMKQVTLSLYQHSIHVVLHPMDP